ncbi:MAG TPA: hypothetical protein VFO55_00515 [Gemmatimonadaceae bacterium]|nr:hypothetical protein [Gemmatimonadaceae bacterium]
MDSLALRPRKATEIIDAAIEVYRRNPVHFLLLAAIVRVPWLVVQIILIGGRDADVEAFVASTFIGLGTLLSTFIMGGFVVHMASELYLGRDTDAFETIRRIWPRIGTVFMASLLQALAIGVGLLLFLFPAVWVTAVTAAVIPVVVLENRGFTAAFSRAAQLSDGMKWHILSAIGLVVLIRVIVEIGIAVVAQLIPMPELRFVAVAAAAMLIYPLLGIAEALVYYDIRIRKEGFDIEMMAQQATAPAPVTA